MHLCTAQRKPRYLEVKMLLACILTLGFACQNLATPELPPKDAKVTYRIQYNPATGAAERRFLYAHISEDPLYNRDNCNKQQFPQCSGGDGGGGSGAGN